MSSTDSQPGDRPLIGSLLRLASQVVTEQFARWIAASGYVGVQPAHSAAIQPLWRRPEGARITALASAAGITKQSMSALVADLEAAGYVERIEDPDDARARRVRLTAHGRAYARAARAFARTVEAGWAEKLGAERIEQLGATLDLLRTTVFLAED